MQSRFNPSKCNLLQTYRLEHIYIAFCGPVVYLCMPPFRYAMGPSVEIALQWWTIIIILGHCTPPLPPHTHMLALWPDGHSADRVDWQPPLLFLNLNTDAVGQEGRGECTRSTNPYTDVHVRLFIDCLFLNGALGSLKHVGGQVQKTALVIIPRHDLLIHSIWSAALKKNTACNCNIWVFFGELFFMERLAEHGRDIALCLRNKWHKPMKKSRWESNTSIILLKINMQ